MLFRVLIAAALTVLVSCGASEQRPTSNAGPLVIGDSNPVSFKGRAPASFPVKGLDAARFQTFVDWKRAKAVGIEFAFLKATEGGDLLDPKFKDHWRGSARAGIRRGAYHFYYFCTAPEVQARWFIRNVPRARGALPPVLDMEWNPFSPSCQRRPDAATVRAEMKIWMDLVEAHFGQRPIIYTTPRFYEENGLKAMRREEFWLRSTAKSLREAYPGQPWSFWQFTSTGTLPGTPGDVDINVFNGSRAAWSNWLSQRTN